MFTAEMLRSALISPAHHVTLVPGPVTWSLSIHSPGHRHVLPSTVLIAYARMAMGVGLQVIYNQDCDLLSLPQIVCSASSLEEAGGK